MKLFNNMKIGTRVMLGYVVILVILVLVGLVAVINIIQLERTVSNLTDNLAKEQKISDDIVSWVLVTRFHANKFIQTQDPSLLTQYDKDFTTFEEVIKSADNKFTLPEYLSLLSKIQTNAQSYKDAFVQIRKAIIDRQQVLKTVLEVQGPISEDRMEQLRDKIYHSGDVELIKIFESGRRAAIDLRFNASKYLLQGDKIWITPYNQQLLLVNESLDSLEKTISDPAQIALVKETRSAITNYNAGFSSIQKDYDKQNSLAVNELDKLGPEIQNNAQEISRLIGNEFEKQSEEVKKTASLNQLILIMAILAAIVLGIGWGVIASRAISIPVEQITLAATKISLGDLKQEITISDKSEIGNLADTFRGMISYFSEMAQAAQKISEGNLGVEVRPRSENDVLSESFALMVKNLRNIVSQISKNAASLSVAANQIMAAASEQAATTREQSTAVTETTTTVEEARQTADHAADRAQSVSDMARESTQLTEQGMESVQEAVESMGSVKEQVGTIAETILMLSEQTQQIGEIINTVNDIADRSTLLAVNAAIEAARAGDAGRGFAVVANEVSSLAKQSQQATARVRDILGEIQKSANSAVMVTEEGTKRSEIGMRVVDRTGKALETISVNFKEVAKAAQQIAASSNEQRVGMDQISLAMTNINEASKQGISGMQQIESATRSLAGMAAQLNEIVNQYRL